MVAGCRADVSDWWAQQDDTEAQHIQLDTSLAEGTEEAGAYLQAKFIDK